MHYDPIKNVFASVLRKLPVLRVLFYKILDLMFLRSWYVRRELHEIRRISAGKNLTIYDAGSGYGQYSYFMATRLTPCSVYAVDVKTEWIEDCRSFFSQRKFDNVHFEVEDLTKIEHKEKFDLIVCVDVMEHIPDDITVFKNFYNALKTGGFLLINSPSVYGGSDVHDEGDESFIGEHARIGYSHTELEEKLSQFGFRTYKYRYTYGFWGDTAWRLGIKYPMLMLNISKIFFVLLPLYYFVTLPFTLIMMYRDFTGTNQKGSGINYIAQKP